MLIKAQKTKFDLSHEVWILIKSVPTKVVINAVYFYQSFQKDAKKKLVTEVQVQYVFEDIPGVYPESQLYPSRKELINSL